MARINPPERYRELVDLSHNPTYHLKAGIILSTIVCLVLIWIATPGVGQVTHNLAEILSDPEEESMMPDPIRPPLPRPKKGERPKTSIHLAPNAEVVAKIIAAGTRDDHPALEIARKAAKRSGKQVPDAR